MDFHHVNHVKNSNGLKRDITVTSQPNAIETYLRFGCS